MLDLRQLAREKGHDGFGGNDVTGIADKPALVSTIKLMDDRNRVDLSNFHAHVVSIC